jgi:hypothetical protein
MAGNNHLFTGQGCLHQSRELAFGIEHFDLHNHPDLIWPAGAGGSRSRSALSAAS